MTEIVKRRLLIISIVVSLLPIGVLIHAPVITSLRTWALYGSAIAGYAGVVLLLWMYILGTRATSRALFTDTAPILTIHGWLGKYGSIAILLHPLLVIYSYGESWLYAVVPQLGTEFERHVTLGRISFILVVIVWVSSALLRGKLAYRPWKYIHYIAYICLPFALLHIPDVGSSYMSSAAVKAYYLLLVIVGFVFTLLRLRSLFNVGRAEYRIKQHTKLMDDTYALTLKPTGASYIAPSRGQYVYIKLGFVSEDHPFSVVQYDEKSHEITLAYRVFGTFTDSLSEYEPGETVLLDGAYGTFTSEIAATDRPSVFIAGGIGITPFVDHILRGDNRERWLFYASPSKDHATALSVLQDELGPRCVPIYSQVPQPGADSGYISAELIQRHLPEPSRYDYFICGPEGMIGTAENALISLGVSKNQIFTEKFAF